MGTPSFFLLAHLLKQGRTASQAVSPSAFKIAGKYYHDTQRVFSSFIKFYKNASNAQLLVLHQILHSQDEEHIMARAAS